MFIPSLRSRRASCPVFALAALLLPAAVSAQPAETEKPRQWVSVTIDYVEAPLTKLMEASQWIASGPQHDTQLLAALVKSGAADTKGLPVFCTDGGTMERSGPVSPLPGTLRRRVQQMPFPYLDSRFLVSRTKATAHFGADGMVTVALAASLASPLPAAPPIFSADKSLLFRDGQILEVSRTLASSADKRQAYLVFARTVVGSGPLPSLSSGSFHLIAPLPYSVDPGMVGTPPATGDEGMAGGRGMDPESIDHMNALVLPTPLAPKRK